MAARQVFTFDFEALNEYRGLSDEELIRRIREHKERRGGSLCLLVHNYQRSEIIELADHVGDSLELAQLAVNLKEAKEIILCGVHFMAETVRILTEPAQRVFIPNLYAGCPMADLADLDEVERAWGIIESLAPGRFTPVVYVNSTAELKAWAGRNGGMTVTSGNAEKVVKSVLNQGKKVFFLPDEHLGRNTARISGIPEEKIALWDWTQEEYGGNAPEAVKWSDMIVWKGYCHVHTHFTREMIITARQALPKAIIMVHPECPEETAMAADRVGSTKAMAELAALSPPESIIVLGTELNHPVNLQKKYPDKTILPLARSLCPNMFKINLKNLLYTLDHLGEVNEVVVPEDVKGEARKALDRMLSVS